jgi:GH24 family phage-related lysozyme (muramidase)/uncharacterized protein YvpB
MTNPVPQQAISLIEEFEGCHKFNSTDGLIHAYADPKTKAEPYTIGWGTTLYPDGRKVKLGDSISKEDADKFFATMLQQKYWEPISSKIPHWQELNDPMRSALCSFAYNLGADFYGGENFNTISACLRDKRWGDVPAALMLYVDPGSDVEAGLRRRRDAEGHLWSQGYEQLNGTAVPASEQQILEAKTETFLKKMNVDSSLLAPNQLVAVEGGKQYKIEKVLETSASGNSRKVQLAYGAGDWWLFNDHWKTATATAASAELPTAGASPERLVDPSKSHLLDVPYLSQLDNIENRYGSCNVTCVAMCLTYLGMPRKPGTQLEDELYRQMERLGWDRHDPNDLMTLINSFPGYKDIFRPNGSFKDIQTSIDAGNPVIIHGYFTKTGHIIVVCGYDDKGLIVNDPYGEYFSSGYDNSLSGEKLHYSYGLIARTCSPESVSNPRNIWYHTVFRV